MAILTTDIYAKCDVCGARHTILDSYPGSYLPNYRYCEDELREAGWTVGKGSKTRCPNCKGKRIK